MNDDEQPTKKPLAGSLDYQIMHENDKQKLQSNTPAYARPTEVKKPKPLIVIYLMALVLMANSIYLLSKTSESPQITNMLRFFGVLGILAGIGLILKSNLARIFTLALCYLSAISSILSFRPLSVLLYVVLIIYLNLSHVKEDFNA